MKTGLRALLLIVVLLLAGLPWFAGQSERRENFRVPAEKLERMPDDHEGRANFDYQRLRNPYTGIIPNNMLRREQVQENRL